MDFVIEDSNFTSSVTLTASTSSFDSYDEETTWDLSLSGTNNHSIALGTNSVTTKLSGSGHYTVLVIPITFQSRTQVVFTASSIIYAGADDKKLTKTSLNCNSYNTGTSTIPLRLTSTNQTYELTLQVDLSQLGCYTVHSNTNHSNSGFYFLQYSGAKIILTYSTVSTITIKYDGNGGTIGSNKTTVQVQVSPGSPLLGNFSNSFSRTGYTLEGWSVDKTATEADYLPGEAITDEFASAYNGKSVTLYAVWKKNPAFDTSSVFQDADMFTGCVNLEGGNGTTYSSNHTDSEYAKIDRDGTPGYFTQK